MQAPSRTVVFSIGTLSVAVAGLAQGPKEKPDRADQDYAAEPPRIAAKEPAKSLREFQPRPGFRIDLVAAEPLVHSPVAAEFDENGRLFVVQLPEYNQYASKEKHGRGSA